MVDLSLLLPAVYGSLLGAAIGILPGLAPAQILAIGFVALMSMDPVALIMFYIGMITVSQYVDSIPAVYFGIPGETSAIPAAFEGPKLRDQGLAEAAVKLTAIGRTMAAVVSVALAALMLPAILTTTWFFSNQAQILLLSLAVAGIAWSSRSTPAWTAISMALGYGLGTIGFYPATGQNWLTFGNINLEAGLPLIVVLMGFYVIPVLIKSLQEHTGVSHRLHQIVDYQISWWQYRWCMLRASVTGWLVGFIPGLSYILSSTVCYNWEKIRQQRQGRYQPGNMSTVVAAETGNTAGAVSTVIPLVLFGIPITGSETILYDIMLMNGADFAQGKFLLAYWPNMLAALIMASLIGIIFCWPMSRMLGKIFTTVNLRLLWIVLLVTIVGMISYLGWYNSQMRFYLTTFAILSITGILLMKKADPVPAMFMFVMQDSIDQAIFNAIQFAR